MKNSFEGQIDHDLLLGDAYKKALETEGEVGQINMKDFFGLYKDVTSDLAYVAEMDRRFRESEARDTESESMLRKMAKVFEVIINEQIELSNWLGDSAMTQKVSKYDDYKHGVDTVVEFDDEDGFSHLALAIDVTSSHELARKFDRIKKEIDQGVLTRIKYFVSEGLSFKGEKGNIPRVVIGADRKLILDLMEKWMEGDKTALALHVVQALLIEEIITQLETFTTYARSIGQNKAADVYQRTLGILMRIKTDKNLSEDMLFKAGEDQVFSAIQNNLYYFR
jgi:hypothetical protein